MGEALSIHDLRRRLAALAHAQPPGPDALLTSGEMRADLGRLYALATGIEVDVAECVDKGLPDAVEAWADELLARDDGRLVMPAARRARPRARRQR
jgi:hypothetical protein